MATAKKVVSIAKKVAAPKKVAAKKVAAKKVATKKVFVPKVMDLTITLESIGAKIGDKVMLGPGLHEIIAFDASKEEQVQLKSCDAGTSGTIRRNIYTVKINLVKK